MSRVAQQIPQLDRNSPDSPEDASATQVHALRRTWRLGTSKENMKIEAKK